MAELDTDAEDDEPNIKRAKTIRFSDEIKSKVSKLTIKCAFKINNIKIITGIII